MEALEYNKEVGFFKEETISNLEGFLKGHKRDGHHFKLEGRIKVLSPDKVEPIGYAGRVDFGITRQQAPIYTIGSADPRMFSRGRRGIAGTAWINKNILLKCSNEEELTFIFEEAINGDLVRITMEGIKLCEQGGPVTQGVIRNKEKDEWTFIGEKVSVYRTPTTNKSFANQLLTKEWVPAWP